MRSPVIVIGGGGHAKVLIDALLLQDLEVAGISDPTLTAGQAGPRGVSVLGDDEAVRRFSPDGVQLVNGVGSTGSTARRREIFERFVSAGYRFTSVIHPSAVIAEDVILGHGVQIMAGAVIQTGTTIGDDTIVNTRASVDHDCRVGDHVHLAPGATLSGGVSVGARTHVGVGAIIIQSISIGPDSLIGAGAVVVEDVPEGTRLTPRNT